MDIKVITRHAPSNYGSLLQAIATTKIIEKLGHKCTIINYIRKDERGLQAIFTTLKNKKEWNDNHIKKILYIILRYPSELIAQYKFDQMRNKYIHLTKRYKNEKELSDLKADIFMTGSDQVWGPTLNGNFDKVYFLSFVKNQTKVAYAASFGKTVFDDVTLNTYKYFLKTYNKITVRENSALNILEKMNLKSLGQVLDPTLLITKEEWFSLIKRNINKKYILVYQIHNDTQLGKYAESLAKHLKLPLYRISPSFHQIIRSGKFIYLPSLGNFLAYLKNCTYLITDSFHGTAFAINFNIQFIEILPNNKTESRNLSLLTLTKLESRIIRNFSDYSIVNTPINYKEVNYILERERKKSIKLLNNICIK